jgi:MOSC domain-containing protein YiiM
MQQVGRILSLYITPEASSKTIEKTSISVDPNGIVEDKHYNKDIERSVLITSIESYDLVQKEGIVLSHGVLGENLLIDYNPYTLPAGSRLQVGENAIFEITQNCTLCKHLAVHDKRIPKLLRNDRGIFAKVVKNGTIQNDDPIYLL